jgi:hypothetical protein
LQSNCPVGTEAIDDAGICGWNYRGDAAVNADSCMDGLASSVAIGF